MNIEHFNTLPVYLRAKKWRFNSLTHLQGPTLARHLDAFEAGHLRETSLIWEAIEQRDDLLRGVINKRKKSVARHGWTIAPKENLDPADRAAAREQVAALSHFYAHLECEHAVDTAERGAFKLLARQMMDAVGKRFAVHEIIWKETGFGTNGTHRNFRNFVTAKFRFVPLAFFENTTGKLRFLEKEGALEGRDLEPGAWMVTVGEGLMMASSTAWMVKHLCMNDWLRFSQRNGTPVLLGKTDAARNSADWLALEEAVTNVLEGGSVVHRSADRIELLNLMGSAAIPFPALVERIDRMLAALWRGADLSTLSRDRGYGASLQEKETCALEEDDAEMLTETLRRYVDTWVIRHVFGEGVRPLAEVKVLVSPRECTTEDLQIDEFLLRHGAPLSIEKTLNRYGRTMPGADERIFSRKNGPAASLPESSLKSGMVMDNSGFGPGPTVSFRGDSPGAEFEASSGANGVAAAEVASLPNQFTVLQEEWVQLSPFGDFPHARGLQRMNRAAAEAMVAQFHSFRGRLGRLFGGVPFYVGHPDLPNSSETVDRKAYGWIMEIEAREEGLFGRVKWSDAGLELLRNAHFKFLSPYWEAREIGQENGRRIYQPIALLSAGLTNQPNIPVRPLANSQESEGRAPRVPLQDRAIESNTASIAGDDVRSRSPEAMENQESNVALAPRQMHTVSCTENLGLRRGELLRLQNRRDRIHECVLAKLRLGMNYDEAWEHVKREHAAWFEDQQ